MVYNDVAARSAVESKHGGAQRYREEYTMTTQNETGSGHALLIGIDKYRNAPPLHGCGNDVQLMASVLPRFGFLPGNIHKLVDGRATRRAILEGLDHLVNVDEVVFVHFSGWGLRVPREGPEPIGSLPPGIRPRETAIPCRNRGRRSASPHGAELLPVVNRSAIW